ncbi:MAG: Holliday junction branch migration protein RuvA [Oligoflexales bacterium]
MIERLKGKLVKITPTSIILDVNGVGYGVEVPLSQLNALSNQAFDIELWIYTHVREDAIRLFGFIEYEDRVAFDVLLSISGIGPKVALAVLSTLSVNVIIQAILQDDHQVFEAVPGVGKRLAEKILLELKPKLKKLSRDRAAAVPQDIVRKVGQTEQQNDLYEDLKSGLENLGFKEKEILPTISKLLDIHPQQTFEWLIKEALTELKNSRTPGKKSGGKTSDVVSDIF